MRLQRWSMAGLLVIVLLTVLAVPDRPTQAVGGTSGACKALFMNFNYHFPECDLTGDGLFTKDDVLLWDAIDSQSPDSRIGSTNASLALPTQLYPMATPASQSGQPFLNKSSQLASGNFGVFSPANRSTWVRNELTDGNKTHFIQTNQAYYQAKGQLPAQYTEAGRAQGYVEEQPTWITSTHILNLGFASWADVPDTYPVWNDFLVKKDSNGVRVQTSFAPGTRVFGGWRDSKTNGCVEAGSSGTFNVHRPSTTAPGEVVISYDEPRTVLKGAYGDATQAPEGQWIELCGGVIHEQAAFETFVATHPGMTYYIFNEMNMSFSMRQDVLHPRQYAFQFAQYSNLIKGTVTPWTSSDSCTRKPLDETATVLVGALGTNLPGRTLLFDSNEQWLADFYAATQQYQKPFCAPNVGYIELIDNKVRTDGFAYYSYVKYPKLPPAPGQTIAYDDLSCAAAVTAFGDWVQHTVSETEQIRTGPVGANAAVPDGTSMSQLFTNTAPYLKEFGIVERVIRVPYGSGTTGASELRLYWIDYLDHGKNPEARYEGFMKAAAKQDLYLTSRMTNWLVNTGMTSSVGIVNAAWLPTYDWRDLRETNGGAALLRSQYPLPADRAAALANNYPNLVRHPQQSPASGLYISPQLTGMYVGLRGGMYMCR